MKKRRKKKVKQRNPIAASLRSPHLRQQKLPARPQPSPPNYRELGEEIYERHSKSFDKLGDE